MFIGSPDCEDIKIAYFNVTWFTPSFGGFWGVWVTFKKPEMAKILKWNGSPQPQTVGFRDLVGTGIAPASKKTAVNTFLLQGSLSKP